MGTVRVRKERRVGSGKKLTRADIRYRYSMINIYLTNHPGASQREISRGVGLTAKQISITFSRHDQYKADNRERALVYRFKQHGKCVSRPPECGPCQRCFGPCPGCHEPVREGQSRHKVLVSRNGNEPHEVWAHLGHEA